MTSERYKAKVVLDTNVYISALLFGGIPEGIIEFAREEKVKLFSSPGILLEAARVLGRKFGFSKADLLGVVSEIRRIGELVYPKVKLQVVKNDPADNRVLECALECRADYIVTGDKKHLRVLDKYEGILIRLPSEFIREWR